MVESKISKGETMKKTAVKYFMLFVFYFFSCLVLETVIERSVTRSGMMMPDNLLNELRFGLFLTGVGLLALLALFELK